MAGIPCEDGATRASGMSGESGARGGMPGGSGSASESESPREDGSTNEIESPCEPDRAPGPELRYGLAAHLRSHAASLAVLVLLELLLALVLGVTSVGGELAALVLALVAGAWVLALVLDYLRLRGFYRDLGELTAVLDRPRLMPELLDEPGFAEGRMAYEALAAVSRGASEEVAAQRRQVEEYRSYVETWVHEAKTPLAAASLAVENLGEGPLACDPGRLRALSRELARVDGYVEQALYYARGETLERDYLVRRHVLREVISAAVRANSDLLIGAHVTPRLGEGLGLAVFTDDKWLVFMLGQLLQNSARYVRPGAEGGAQVWFDARLVGEGTAEECVELVVRDNGCGVSTADLPRVFERGFTGENGRDHKRSTGLGLWLVARLAHKMGVSVSADSRAGEGFSVTLGFSTNKMHYFG